MLTGEAEIIKTRNSEVIVSLQMRHSTSYSKKHQQFFIAFLERLLTSLMKNEEIKRKKSKILQTFSSFFEELKCS